MAQYQSDLHNQVLSMRLNNKVFRSLFLVGPMGVGKTTIGKQLARELSLEFIDSDHEIEKRAGADIPWIFEVEGEAGFREREAKVLEELTHLSDVLISTGGGCVLSDKNRQHLKSRGVVVFLDTSLDIQLMRTKKDKKRPLLQNVNHSDVLTKMKAVRDPLYNDVCHIKIFVGKSSGKRVVSSIIDNLVDHGLIEKSE